MKVFFSILQIPFSFRSLRSFKMALKSNALLASPLSFGQFDLFNPQRSPKSRTIVNRLIKTILFFNAFKLLLVVLAAWLGYGDLKLYLIEIYLFDMDDQKLLDIGISFARFERKGQLIGEFQFFDCSNCTQRSQPVRTTVSAGPAIDRQLLLTIPPGR